MSKTRKVSQVRLAECPCGQMHLVMIDAEGKEFAELTMTPAIAKSLGKAIQEGAANQERRFPAGVAGGRTH